MTSSSPASRAEARAPRRSASCCSSGERGPLEPARRGVAVRRRARRPCRQDDPPALERGAMGAVATASSTARSPIRAAPAGWASRRCATSIASAATDFLPDRTLVLLPRRRRGAARPRARRQTAATASAVAAADYHHAVDAAFRLIAAEGAGAGQADRRLRTPRRRHAAPARRARRTCCRDRRPGPRGRAVRERLGSRASCIMPGCWPGPKGWARRASPGPPRGACSPTLPGRRSSCRGSRPRRSSDRSGWSRPAAIPTCAGSSGCEREDRRPRPQHQRRPGPRARRVPDADARAMSPWRVVVIDSVDELEASARQRLLKMLEEPPANTLVLPRQPRAGPAAADDPLALPPARFRSRWTMTP